MKIVSINASMSGTKTELALSTFKFSDSVVHNHINLKDLKMSFADGRDFREYDNDNKDLVEALIEADALLIGTPIYQASIPGVLKNVFDLLPPNALQGKTVGLVVTAGSSRHYLVAQQHIMPIFHYLKMNVISKYVFLDPQDFSEAGINQDVALRLETLKDELERETKRKLEEDKARFDFM